MILMIISPMLKCKFRHNVYYYMQDNTVCIYNVFSVFKYYDYKYHFELPLNSIKCLHSMNSIYKIYL